MSFFAFTGSPTFLYSFDWLTPPAFPNVGRILEEVLKITDPRVRGVPHVWDLQYTFGPPQYNTSDDKLTYELFGKLWTNFIVYGYF